MTLEIALPPGFEIARVEIGSGDRHEAGREAARRALAAIGIDPEALAYEGTRPIVRTAPGAPAAAVSITHGRTTALAIAARVNRLGIDLCDDDPRLPALATRFLADELALRRESFSRAATRALAAEPTHTVHTSLAGGVSDIPALAACFAAKEAALKALGLGLLDGGVLDGTAVRVVSIDPPKLSHADLQLALGRVRGGAVAVVYS